MLSDKTIKYVRRTSVILLIGMPFLFIVSFLDKGKPYEDLVVFKRELVSVEKMSYGYSSGRLRLTLSGSKETFTGCIGGQWRILENLPRGSEIEIMGYHFGPCGVQAMQVSSDGRVIVSYEDFIQNLGLGNRRLRIMSGVLFVLSLVAFLISVYTRPDIKTFS